MKYYCDLFQDAKGNAKKKVWNEVNEVCYRNSTSESVQCIISDGIQHTTPKSIASAMNSFFASIGKRLADKITTTWPNCNSSTDLPKSQFQLAELGTRGIVSASAAPRSEDKQGDRLGQN